MSINPSLTYSVAGVDRDMAKKQENVRDEEYKRSPRTTQMRPAAGQERPNHPRVSQKVKQGANNLFVQHPGGMKSNFTNQVNISIGSMSDSLNTRFLMKKAAANSAQNQHNVA